MVLRLALLLLSMVFGGVVGLIIAKIVRSIRQAPQSKDTAEPSPRPSTPRPKPNTAAAASADPVAVAKWSVAPPLADGAESDLIARATQLLDSDLLPLPAHHEIELLRHLRCQGPAIADALAATYASALRWRRANAGEQGVGARPTWPAPIDLADGAWAAEFLQIGLMIGRARGGHPVRLERAGRSDLNGASRQRGGEARLRRHYLAMLEARYHGLNADSAACGRLLSAYEIYDMSELSVWQVVGLPALRFAGAVIDAYKGAYPGVCCRSVMCNVPPALALPIRRILSLVPEHMQRKLLLLGESERFEDFASDELDASALAMLRADARTLLAHAGEPLQRANGNGSAAPL